MTSSVSFENICSLGTLRTAFYERNLPDYTAAYSKYCYSELKREKLTKQDVGNYFVRVYPKLNGQDLIPDYSYIPTGSDVDKVRFLGRSYTKEFLSKSEELIEGIKNKLMVFDRNGSLVVLNESIRSIQMIAYKLLDVENNGDLVFKGPVFKGSENLYNDGYWVSVQDFAAHLDTKV